MSRIKYVIGSALEPQATGKPTRFIAHCLSNTGAHDAGFAEAVGRKYPSARQTYKNACSEGVDAGECVCCWPAVGLCIVGMIGQDGLGPTSLRHNWLGAALHNLAANAIQYNASVHMPRIGCGLAGGKWADVEPLILAAFNTPLASFVPVLVYDLPPCK